MKFKKNKNKSVIAVFLLLAFVVASIALPDVSAHNPAWTVPTFSYISASPSPIGLTQPITIIFWLDKVPPTATGQYGDRWENMQVQVTKPDGSIETLGPFTSDPVGSGYTIYSPSQVGNYKFVLKFPGQTITGKNPPILPATYYRPTDTDWINDTYKPSQSDPVFVTVQKEPIGGYNETPLPDGFWTRPIYGTNRAWSQISSNWLQGAYTPGNINPYGTGPESAHVMWTLPYTEGGIMDGQLGEISYYDGNNYENFFTKPIILNGKLYYSVETPPRYGWYCVDLQTGEKIWYHNSTGPLGKTAYGGGGTLGSGGYEMLNFGQILNIANPNQFGGFGYLWSIINVYDNTTASNGAYNVKSTTWAMYDSFTGNWICSIANISATGTNIYGKDGSILYYRISGSGANQRLMVWNTTQAIWWEDNTTVHQWVGNEYWSWRPFLGETFNGNNGFSLNVSIPNVQGSILEVVEGQQVIGGTAGQNDGKNLIQGNLWALSLKPGQEGKLLWNRTYTPPPRAEALDFASHPGGRGNMAGPLVNSENRIFYFKEGQSRKIWGYDLDSMQQLWESTPEGQWNYYGQSTVIYQGKLLSYGYSGELRAYDCRTGKILWNWTSGTVGFEGYYQNTPLLMHVIADGKIYLESNEHSPSKPLRRDNNIWCVDLNSGKLLWQLQFWAGSGYGPSPALADGYLVALNTYDNQIYCIGKGPSVTSVSAPQPLIAKGQDILITGSVTDECAGAKGLVKDGKFNSVPAIADGYQQVWMEYLYMQQPMPTNAKGVQVHLTAIDPNGNLQDIGVATSDSHGNFGFTWNPPVPGTYKVLATFDGSNSYGGSSATTYFSVASAASPFVTAAPTSVATPTSTSAPTQASTPSVSPSIAPQPTSGMPTETYIAIAAAVIIIIAVAAALALRRRK